MKHSILEDTTRRLGETVLIALVVLMATGWVATKVLGSTNDGKDAKKKIELTQLAGALRYYGFDNGAFPKDPGGSNFCKIDVRYRGKKCLGELVTDGYLDALPVSFDDEAYWYLIYKNYVAVGSSIDGLEDTTDTNKCALQNGFEFWCVKIQI